MANNLLHPVLQHLPPRFITTTLIARRHPIITMALFLKHHISPLPRLTTHPTPQQRHQWLTPHLIHLPTTSNIAAELLAALPIARAFLPQRPHPPQQQRQTRTTPQDQSKSTIFPTPPTPAFPTISANNFTATNTTASYSSQHHPSTSPLFQ